jgi:RNA polymerase sigma-70 factor (ECF subfamily)
MRQILVDGARERLSQKRGGDAVRVELTGTLDRVAKPKSADIVALDAALDELAKADPRKSQIVELRYFGGLTEEEAAQALGLSVATIRKEMRLAEAWLHSRM